MKKLVGFALVSLVFLVVTPVSANPGTLFVDDNNCPGPGTGTAADPYCRIQDAINAAVGGDTVSVAPGTYVENINFLGKAIAVESQLGPVVTVIDGNQADSVVTIVSGEGASSVLKGLTIQNGRSGFDTPGFGDGGGIRIQSSSPTIVDNIITNNRACNGVGVSIRFGSPTIQRNTISNNIRSGCSGGLGGGGIALGFSTSAQIVDNVISNNSGGVRGGGIALNGARSTDISNNIISENTAGDGGGIAMINVVTGTTLVQNLITDNFGHAVHWINAPQTLVNNTIVSTTGAGIFGWSFASPLTMMNNIVVGRGPAAIECRSFSTTSPPVVISNNAFSPTGPPYGANCVDQTGVNGNISADLLFVDTSMGDYHLRLNSPSVDAGDNGAPGLPAADLDGDARIFDGDGDGQAVVDMGVDETTEVFTNEPPVAEDDSYSTLEDTPLMVAAPGVLANDSDPDGDTLVVDSFDATSAFGGSVVVNADGSFSYTPDGGFVGIDTYTYSITDGNGEFDTATVTITVEMKPNEPPVAEDDSYSTHEGTPLVVAAPGVLGNDGDPDDDPLVVDSFDATSAFGGSVVVNADGSFSYAPDGRFAGVDSYGYTITDGNDEFDSATATITVDALHQRSVEVEALDGTVVGDALAGSFVVSDQSENGNKDDLDVQITALSLTVEKKQDNDWVAVGATCTFNPDALLVFGHEVAIDFSCVLDESLPDGTPVRVTVAVSIFGRDNPFTLTQVLGEKGEGN